MIKCAGVAKQKTGAKHKDNRLELSFGAGYSWESYLYVILGKKI